MRVWSILLVFLMMFVCLNCSKENKVYTYEEEFDLAVRAGRNQVADKEYQSLLKQSH